MRKGILAALLALSMIVAVGCGDDAGDAPGSPPDPRLESDGHEPLVGSTWRVDRLVGGQTKLSTAGMNEPPRILLTADDRMQVFTGCNTAGGRAIAGDAFIRFGPIGISRARCGGREGRVESALLDPLRSRVKYEFIGKEMKWTAKGFDLYFSPMGAADKMAVPARPDLLAGRAFVLNSVAGDALTVDVPLNLSFRLEDFGADATCNHRSYGYAIRDGRITGQLAMSTEMLCPGPEGRQERAFQKLIRNGADTALGADRLTLDFGGGVMADFTDEHEPLVGTSWRMIDLKGGRELIDLETRRGLGFSVDGEGNFGFSTPCNGGGGKLRLGVGSMTFRQTVTTAKGCNRKAERLQDQIQAMFIGEAEYRFEGPELVMVNGSRVLRLEPDR